MRLRRFSGVSCQRWSGAAFGCVVSIPRDKVKIEGEIKEYNYVGFNKDDGESARGTTAMLKYANQ